MRKASEIIIADAKILGKKDGYEEASLLYNAKYKAVKKEYDMLEQQIKQSKELYGDTIERLLQIYEGLKGKYDLMVKDKNINLGAACGLFGMAAGEILELLKSGDLYIQMSILDFLPVLGVVMAIKRKQYITGYKEGYMENKTLLEKKLNNMIDKNSKLKEEGNKEELELMRMIYDIMEEIVRLETDIYELKSAIEKHKNQISRLSLS